MKNISIEKELLVKMDGIHKNFGKVEVLKGIDLHVEKGEVVSIIGRSGSGKSTLLRCINGLEEFQQGSLLVGGLALDYKNEKSMKKLRKKVGMIFQQFNLFPTMSAGENIMLAPRLVDSLSKDDARKLTEQLLKQVGLDGKFNSKPAQLSGGQQQRVAIARALAMNPEVILCDEMTSSLDPELVNEVLQVIEQLANEGATLIIVTHEMDFAKKVSDRIIFMHEGKVHEMGTPSEIFDYPKSKELQTFLSFEAY